MLTLILKAITSCNLRCIYCSVGDKKHSARMDGPTMTVALEWFANYALKRGEKIVSFILHGG